MSRLPRLSIKGKGSKVKPQPEAESSFVESGSSVTAGGAHGGTTPQFAAGGTGMSSPGSQASGTFMASPGSPPPLLTSQELLSPDSTDSASETSLSKTEMKKLADKRKADKEAERRAEDKRKADKKEAEERRLEAERLRKERKRKEEESKKSKGKKSDPKSPQDESSSYSEDILTSSTLVSRSTAIPGAAADLPLRDRSELVVKSEHEAGHRGEMGRKIHNLEQQVKSVKSIIRDRNLLHGLSKEQSRAVLRLQQQLETTESEKRNLEEVQYGEAVAKLEQSREELKQVKEESDSALAELQQLQQDLITAEDESNKELKRAKSTAKLQLETEQARTLRSGSEDAAAIEIAELREVLGQKERKIHNLEQQVKSVEGIIRDRNLLHGHSKEQSRAVFRLQQQLETTESQKRNIEEVQYGEAVAKLEQAREELKLVKEERDSARTAVQQLQQDLTTAENESNKELKTAKSTAKLQLETEQARTLRSGSEDAAAIEIAELREVLGQKERKIHNLEQQVKSVEGIIRDRNLLHGHSKEQSRAVFRLQQQLETTESQKRNIEEVQYGEAVAKLEQAREELKLVKEERDSARTAVQQLQQDLTTAENESNKELKTAKSTAKLQLETEQARTEQLQLEIQGWEANVKRLKAELYLLKVEKEAIVADTIVDPEEGIAALQRALSDAENERLALYRDYIEEKKSHERAEQECIELGVKLSNVQLEVDKMKTQALGWKETMEGQGGIVATLNDKMEGLIEENHDLKEEIEARRQEVQIVKEDFEAERYDREQAARYYDDEKAKMTLEHQRLDGAIYMYRGEIDRLKEELARNGELRPKFESIQMELVAYREQVKTYEAQQIAMKNELEESHQNLEKNTASTAKLHEEVLAKARQVKQYKEQVDGYVGQVEEMTAEMEGLKTELQAYQQQAVLYREQKETLQAERVRLWQQLQRQEDAAQQQSQLLQQRLDAALAEVQRFRHSPQIASKSHKRCNVSRQEVQILSEIGRGAWGTVCKGKFQGRQVAVKLPHPAILDEHTIDRLQREVKIMAEVRHPNLLQFIGAVFDNEVPRQPPLIILELLDMNLRMAYQRKRLLGSSRIPIFRDVAYALHYLHEHQEPIIHRDVSAPNVLLEELPNGMWRAKVSDFGSANLARLAQTMGEGAIIYAAPETIPQARRLSSPPLPQTTKIDVYSYGILLCEVIMSQLPDPERFWIMLQQVQRQWPFMHKLIVSCTSDIANERPTMAEVLDQLNTLPRPQLSSRS